jgi:L-fuculose-phosphate aldolase
MTGAANVSQSAAKVEMAKLKHVDLRKEVIATCLQMNAEGINQGTSGNVSVRTDRGFLITASGIPYHRAKPVHIVEMDLEGGYFGDFLPSTEWRMHFDIYRTRPEASAIVHVHSTYAAALSCIREDIPAFHYMIGVTGGTTLRVSEYAEFGTQELSDAMLVAMTDRRACLLANHGQICFGPTLDKALWLAIEVETLCKQYWVAKLAGNPVILEASQMRTVLARFATYGKQASDLGGRDMAAVIPPVRRDEKAVGSRRKRP